MYRPDMSTTLPPPLLLKWLRPLLAHAMMRIVQAMVQW